MFNLPMDTTIVFLIIVGLIVADVIGIIVQIHHLPEEKEEEHD